MDVAPTLLDLCGIPPPSETAMQGRSLRRLLEGSAEPWSRALFFEWKESGLRTSSWKVIRAADGWKLFDLRQDAGERHDLLADGPPPSEGAALIRLFEEEERRRAELKDRMRAAGQAAVTLTESELENLRSLGYAGDD